MAKAIIASGGGGGAMDQTGSAEKPIFINSEGDVQVCSDYLNIRAALVTSNQANSTQFNLVGVTAANGELKYNSSVYVSTANVLRGAGWNDYAETRFCKARGGYCVCETGNGDLVLSTERLQAGANIVSDTFGMLIGPEGDKYQPIAISGRVLAYHDDSDFKAGDAVCAAPNGVVSKMTRDEIKEWPDRIVGYVSEIPTYSQWNNVEIDGRIWITIK